MQQTLHLLTIDRARASVLAARHRSSWLLPVVTCAERMRPDAILDRWMKSSGVSGDLAGQWLGRATPAGDALEWLLVIDAVPGRDAIPALAWTPIDFLTTHHSLLEYQEWAIAKVLKGHASPLTNGPFGNVDWLREVKRWVRLKTRDPRARIVTPFRVTTHEVVLGVQTCRGRAYFKGLAAERSREARLTRAFSAAAPDSFARTLALEEQTASVWWLADECPGRPAGGDEAVAAELGRVQQHVMKTPAILRDLPQIDLGAAAAWAADLLVETECRSAMARGFAEITRAGIPQTWTPMDLDPSNVLVDDCGRVRFIDLDDAFIGPAPVAMAAFAGRCRAASLYGAYENAWSPPLSGVRWPDVEIAACVLEAWLGWTRVRERTNRGEVHGVLPLATKRLTERLATAIQRR